MTVAEEAAEAVGEELLRLGARGSASEDLGPGSGPLRVLIAYFPAGGAAGEAVLTSVPSDLRAFLGALPGWGLDPGPAGIETRLADEAEWRDQWKAFFRPTRVGRRLIIHPPWELPADSRPGDLPIIIDPGQAFGTGNHATTRGAMELLEAVLPGCGASGPALDLGTGSGILAIAAAKLGVGKVIAVDNDPVATEAARRNAVVNGVADRVEVIDGDLSAVLGARPDGPAPLILANLTTDLIVSVLPDVAAALSRDGILVTAGISTGEGAARVIEAARSVGLNEIDRRTDANWTSFAFSRRPAPGGGRVSGRVSGDRPRAVFYTLGCKANLYDTAGMMDQLREEGWHVVARHEEEREEGEGHADAALYVVNSCAVTTRAESKSRQLVRRLKREHPAALVALVGCYPEVRRATAPTSAGDDADLVLGTSDRTLLPKLLRERGLGRPPASSPALPVGPEPAGLPVDHEPPESLVAGAFAGERTRATLKVQDGCDQFCTYCVIPYARGPSRSRPAAEVLDEAVGLARAGFKEVVVTGIHLGAWGPGLADLIRDIAAIPRFARVRLSSIEPMEVTDDLIELLATNPRVCRHLHVPLQSGSDTVLARMNRHYTAADYLAMVARVRSRVPLLGLTTDVMVGFPGETDEEFRATLDTAHRARFSRLHVFRFSRRPGTPAADMPGQVDVAVKKARSEELIRLGRQLGREFHESLLGLTLEVLVERAGADPPGGPRAATGAVDGVAEGLTDNYVRVTVAEPAPQPNDLVTVRIEKATTEGVVGRPQS